MIPQHDLILNLGDEMAEQVENGISYKIDNKEVNVLKNNLLHKNGFSNVGNYTKQKLLPWVSYFHTELMSDLITSVLT